MRGTAMIFAAMCTACIGKDGATGITAEARSPAIKRGRLLEPVGIETLGGVFTPILQPCGVPCEKTEVFSTASDNQSEIIVRMFRGSERLASGNSPVGVFVIGGIPPQPRGVPNVEVTFAAVGQDVVLRIRDRKGAVLSIRRQGAEGGGTSKR